MTYPQDHPHRILLVFKYRNQARSDRRFFRLVAEGCGLRANMTIAVYS